MPSDFWKISINGAAPVSCASLGIRNLQLALQSFAADTLTFSVPIRDIYTAPAVYGYKTSIQLYAGTTCAFAGEVIQVSSNMDPAERVGVTCMNFWRRMERIIYQQKHVLIDAEDFASLSMALSTHVTLGQDEWGHKIPTNTQIGKIMGYAQSRGSGLPVVAAIGTYVEPPLSEARDISCAAAIMRMVEYTPDTLSWVDYSSGSPVMTITRRQFMDSESIDLADKNLVTAISNLRPRYDLKITGVLFTFITGTRNPDTDELIPVETQQTAGSPGGEGTVAATIQLAGQGSDQAEEIPSSLAAEYYNALNTLSWEGGITIKEPECSLTWRPAMLLSLLNGQPAWATMAAMIQSVTMDIDHGMTNIEFGVPGYLGAADFADLMARFRTKKPAGDFPAKQHNGDAGVPGDDGGDGSNPDNPGGPANSGAGRASGGGGVGGLSDSSGFQADVCKDGNTATRTFRGV